MRIITPTRVFPDPLVVKAASALMLMPVRNTLGKADMIEELSFEAADGSLVSYLREPELEIPVITIEGFSAAALRDGLAGQLAHADPLVAAAGYTADASVTIKLTLLRILSAHALEMVTDPMIRVAELAARDASPYVRLGVFQLLQYAHEATIADIVRHRLLDDGDPDVRSFAKSVLARFDAAPKEMGSDD